MIRTRATPLPATSALGITLLSACGSGQHDTALPSASNCDGPGANLRPPAGKKAAASTDDSGGNADYGY
jgi:hypothetical protein